MPLTIPMLMTIRRDFSGPVFPAPDGAFLYVLYSVNTHCMQYVVTEADGDIFPDQINWREKARFDEPEYDVVAYPPAGFDAAYTGPFELIRTVDFDFDAPEATGTYAQENGFSIPVLVTIPDGMDTFDGRVAYKSGTGDAAWIISLYTLTHTFADQGETGPLDNPPPMYITVTKPDEDSATIAIDFIGIRHSWDGAEYHSGFTKAQLKVDGIVTDFELTGALDPRNGMHTSRITGHVGPDTESREFIPGVGTVWTPPLHTAESFMWRYQGSLTIPFTDKDIFIRRGNEYGQWDKWHALYYVPEIVHTNTVIEGTYREDCTGSRALGATIGEGSGGYELTIYRGDLFHSYAVPRQSSPIIQVELEEMPIAQSPFAELEDNEVLNVILIVTTDKGCQSIATFPIVYDGLRLQSVFYDEKRLTWWRLYGDAGQMKVDRHLKHEPPSEGIVIGPGKPGNIKSAGAQLYVTSKAGHSYASIDEGETWGFIMAIAAGLTIVATAAEEDGSAKYHLGLDGDGGLVRYVERRNANDWIVEGPEPVAGLPESTRQPGDAYKSGATILLTAKADGGDFSATSTDNMLNWTVTA